MDHKIDGLALVPLLTPVVDKRCRASQVPVAEGVREQMQLFGDNYSSTSATIRIPFEEPAACAPSFSAVERSETSKRGGTRREPPDNAGAGCHGASGGLACLAASSR